MVPSGAFGELALGDSSLHALALAGEVVGDKVRYPWGTSILGVLQR